MADTTKTAVRNIAPGIRGLNAVTGYRDLAPGELVDSVELSAAELESAKSTGYFRFGKAAESDPAAESSDEPARLDNPTAAVTGGPAGTTAPPARATGGGSTDELDRMSDEDLKQTTAALTGKTVKSLPDDREKLLKLARGE